MRQKRIHKNIDRIGLCIRLYIRKRDRTGRDARRFPFVRRTALLAGLVLLMSGVLTGAEEEFDMGLTEILEVLDNRELLGDTGRLLIPEVGVDVALYFSGDNVDDAAQTITDGADSAVYMPWTREVDLIADHWNQGFLGIRDCVPGTRAYVKKEEKVEEYVCILSTTGHNLETDLVLEDGRHPEEVEGCDLFLYTCNQRWQDIYVVIFSKGDEILT